MDIKKNKLKIGKIRVDIYPKSSEEKINKDKVVTLKPDPEQSDESKIVALNFLSNAFKSKSNYGSGIIQFKLNDPKGWKNKYGDKFIKAISNSSVNISWTGDYKAIKGLKSLIPKIDQFNYNPGFMGNIQPDYNKEFNPGMSDSKPLDTLGNKEMPQQDMPQQDMPKEISPPENASYIYDMKNLIQLWEKINNDI